MTNVFSMRKKETITIRNQTYTFTGTSIKSGSRADILKLEAQSQMYALKVFRQEFYQRYDYAVETARYQILQNIRGYEWVTQRVILNPDQDATLIATHELLQNAVLMPWFDYESWSAIKYRIINNELTMPTQATLNTIAANIAHAIYQLNDSGHAHGDINDNNVLINIDDGSVVFIDIEDMFDQTGSDVGAAGTPGYRFNQSYTAWDSYADRFSTALFISEIIGFAETVKQGNIRYEGYFTQDELDTRDTNSKPYQVLTHALQQINADLHVLFTKVWQAQSLAQCPDIFDWQKALSAVFTLPPAPNIEIQDTPIQQVLNEDNSHRYIPKTADSNYPALIVFLLDYSQSMINMEMGNTRNQKRADRMFEMVGELLYMLKGRSEKGQIIAPRYHVAFFAYGKTCINVLQLFDQNPHVPKSKVQEKMPARGLGIWQLPTLIETIGGYGEVADIQHFFTTNYQTVAQHIDTGDTYMTEAFLQVKELLKPELVNEYQACAAPMLIHITDGFNMDPRDVVPVVNDIQKCSTEYGNLLVSTTYIGPNIIDLPADLRTWPGVGSDTLFKREYINNGRLLSSISSPIPDILRKEINYDSRSNVQNYALVPGSRLLFPGNQESMIKLSLTAATATTNS